jgi:hypothetical protein
MQAAMADSSRRVQGLQHRARCGASPLNSRHGRSHRAQPHREQPAAPARPRPLPGAAPVHHRGAPPTTAADKPTTAASANCTLARTNLERLQAGGDIGLDANGDGQPDAALSAEEHERQTRLAAINIKTFCTPQAAAAP